MPARFSAIGLSVGLCLAILSPSRVAGEQTSPTEQAASLDSEDLERGRRLFVASCARCHGIEGTGGEGPTLNQPTLRHAADESGLRSIIRQGIRGTDMPGARYINDSDLAVLAGYVRSLGRTESVPLPGDVSNGKALFVGDGRCATCHIVSGHGESLGPDLSLIGARRGNHYLREHITNPGTSVAEQFLMVRVQTQGGHTVRGMRVNEDAFSLQLRDEDGKFHSFRKAELLELARQPGRTFMPSYRRLLSDPELDDVVAYLASLRGES